MKIVKIKSKIVAEHGSYFGSCDRGEIREDGSHV